MILDDVDHNKLRTFLLVADGGGLSAAAARLGLTRSAVSQSVSGLEASLATALFHRAGRQLTLTREGRLLYEGLRDQHAGLQRVLDQVVAARHAVQGLLRIGVFVGFSRLRLATVLSRFAAAHPEARTKVVYAPHGELRAHLEQGRVDVTFSLVPMSDRSRALRSVRLLRQELVLVGRPSLVAGVRDLPRLRTTPVVDYYRTDPLIHRWIRHHYRTRPPALDVRIWAASTDLVLDLALAGAGVAVLPRDLVEPLVARRRLAVVATGHPELVDHLWLNERASPYASALLDAFRALVTAELPAP